MPDPEVVSIYTTVPDAATAEALASELLSAELVACVNVLPGVRSHYRWQGALQVDDELVLLCKTRAALVEVVSARIREAHPYDLPCVVALPVVGGLPEYLAWVARETGGARW